MPQNTDLYVRNIIFGVADSLVSTVGLLSGIDMSGTSRQIIIMTGIVYAFVEAFSMAIGSFLSEESAEEYEIKGEVSGVKAVLSGTTMFISFIIASFIPILPYLFFGFGSALLFSMIFSMIALFTVGIISAKISKVNVLKHGLKMVFLGGAAIIIGAIVGKFIRIV